jgi:hypothetical protein
VSVLPFNIKVLTKVVPSFNFKSFLHDARYILDKPLLNQEKVPEAVISLK